MEDVYTAKVKNIKEGTRVGTKSTSFVYGMKSSIGKTLNFIRLEYSDWYQETEDKYVYHRSWLENLEKQMTPETKYLVVSVRKSDGQTFFPENVRHRKGIDNYSDAIAIANRKARENSTDYLYVVYQCVPVASAQKEIPVPPVRVTFY